MTASLSGVYNAQFFTDAGALAAGGRLYTYSNGTTTHKAAYTDAAGLVPHTYTSDGIGGQYIALNSRGELPAPLYLATGSYDLALKTVAGATVWTRRADPVGDVGANIATDLASTTDAAKGAGLVSSLWTLNYAAGTLGNDVRYGQRPSIFKVLSAAQQADVLAKAFAIDLTATIAAALMLCKQWYFPAGGYKVSGASGVQFAADKTVLSGEGSDTIIYYSGTGKGIDYNGQDRCRVYDLQLWSPNSAQAVYIGDIAHWFKLIGCDIRGSSTGGDLSGTKCAGVGIQVERSYYGEVTGNDVSFFQTTFQGLREFNGNYVCQNSFRQFYRGIHITDATANTEGSTISNNALESADVATISGLDLQGADGIFASGNRIELTTCTQAHIYVHDGVGPALRNDVSHNLCIGAGASVKIGDGSGSSRVKQTTIKGGYYNGSFTIGVDADYTDVDVNRRMIADGVSPLVNGSASTILTYADDSPFSVGMTGLTTTPTAQWRLQVAAGIVTLHTQTINGTSNTTACTITGLPTLIRPTNPQTVQMIVQENGTTQSGKGVIDSAGVITLSSSVAGAAFTAAGSKGFIGCVITYPLN